MNFKKTFSFKLKNPNFLLYLQFKTSTENVAKKN